jgi:uncharacterized protein YukE
MKTASEEIRSEWRRFESNWEEVRATWNDEVADAFSRRFISPWGAKLPALLRTLESLEEATRNAERAAS